jgi:hypothetical protein
MMLSRFDQPIKMRIDFRYTQGDPFELHRHFVTCWFTGRRAILQGAQLAVDAAQLTEAGFRRDNR